MLTGGKPNVAISLPYLYPAVPNACRGYPRLKPEPAIFALRFVPGTLAGKSRRGAMDVGAPLTCSHAGSSARVRLQRRGSGIKRRVRRTDGFVGGLGMCLLRSCP